MGFGFTPHAAATSRRARVALIGALLAGALVMSTAHAVAGVAGRITVGRAATVEGATVRLADVAVLEGNGTDFAAVELGPAPDAGGSRRLEGVAILRTLRAAGLDDGVTRYEIPASVRVARAYQELGPDELRPAIERDVAVALAAGERIRDVDVGSAVRIPQGPYQVRVVAAGIVRGARRRLDVDIVQDDTVVASVPAHVEIAASGPVVVVRHAVERGHVLKASDVAVEDRDLSGMRAGVVTALADAIGKETRTALPAGAPLTVAAIASPLLVRRGDLVTVIVETPGMRLSTPGEALEPGAAGAPIRVRNRTSQQELRGQVVDHGMVLVQY